MSLLPMPFNNPDTYPGHSGVDFGQSRGTLIPASGPGVVTVLGYNPRAGYTTWVRYDAFPGVEAGYCHQDRRDAPAPGTRVVEGSWLGYVGSLGLNSTGPHLHLEMSPGGTYESVWRYFDPNRVVGDVPTNPTPIATLEDDMPDSMFAVVDGVPSWCWINWATGKVHAVHTQAEADWIGSYMGSVRNNFSGDADGGTSRYKSKLKLVEILMGKPALSAQGVKLGGDE